MPKHALHLPLTAKNIVSGKSVDNFVDVIGASAPGNWVATSKSIDAPFLFEAGSVTCGGLTIGSTYQTPVSYQNAVSDCTILSFSTQGAFEYDTAAGAVHERRGSTASLIAANDQTDGQTNGDEANASIALYLDPSRLQQTYRVMTGDSMQSISLNQTRELKLQYGRINFDAHMRHLIAMKNAAAVYNTETDFLGFEDLFYRWSVMLLKPETFIKDVNSQHPQNNTTFDRLCNYMQANLMTTLTLTDLEEFSGLSARALQLQFLKRFGCSPMAWLRDQRLEAAHQTLLRDPTVSVTQVALAYCFTSPSRFAAAYKSKFGDLPSDLRKNTR